jgi:nitroreductase
METNEAIQARCSTRGFKSDQVPQEIVRAILRLAIRAPTGKNLQPWEFKVVTGDVLDRIRWENVAILLAGEPERPDVPIAYATGTFKEREVQTTKAILGVMGIRREDTAKRLEWWQRGFRFFDAPVAVLILADSQVDTILAHHDIGALSQTLCLAALDYGLGTCIVRQGVLYPDVIRRHVEIPPNRLIISAIALGYPDSEFPANQVRTDRIPVEEITTWHGF